MLFNKLPDDLFLPLAGQNRAVYQAVLQSLADVFFDEDLIDPFVPKDFVRSAIEDTVVRLGVRRWSLEGYEADDELELPRSSHEYANRIYRRLAATGWLEEEQRVYRSYVLLSPAISFLLRSFVSISNLEKRSYGGAVLNILSSLESAVADPRGRGITLAEAAQTAADFSAHLTDMMLGLRELKMSLSSSNNPQEIVRNFFDRFVEQILVSDYKTLKTKNNPFRFRRLILSLLRDLQFDDVKINQLTEHYQEQYETDYHDAQARVQADINRIVRIFESVDQRLDKIDDFRYRLEKRVADTVRYMDKTTPGMSSRLSRVIAGLSELDEAAVPVVDTLESMSFLSSASIRSPVRRRVQAQPRVIKQQEIDPRVLELRQLFKEYKDRREVTPQKVELYLESQLTKSSRLSAVDFSIETIEDYICFSYVRHMHSMGKKANSVVKKYDISFKEGYVDVSGMVTCRDFEIQRKV